jgi:four helix bundle protein
MMKKKNIIQEKSFIFSMDIIKLHNELLRNKEYVLGKQLLRSGTSIGANIEEALGAASKKDFLYKMKLAYKESRESHYWLKLLKVHNNIPDDLFIKIEEINRILSSIVVSTKKHFY